MKPLDRELAVMRSLASCLGDEARINEAEAELERLRQIESLAMACDGIDMGQHYEVPVQAWEALMEAVWRSGKKSKFDNVFCSQCGQGFGPGDHGFSHCDTHRNKTPTLSREIAPSKKSSVRRRNDGDTCTTKM